MWFVVFLIVLMAGRSGAACGSLILALIALVGYCHSAPEKPVRPEKADPHSQRRESSLLKP
jgi:hypothetical protein